MPIKPSILLALCLLLAVPARAEEAPHAEDTAPTPAVSDAIYKGVIGKALDALPIPPEERAMLQRTNAVVSSTVTGRSLAIWAGLSNPVFMVAGLVWGLFSASNIKPAQAAPVPARHLEAPPEFTAPEAVAVLTTPPVLDDISPR